MVAILALVIVVMIVFIILLFVQILILRSRIAMYNSEGYYDQTKLCLSNPVGVGGNSFDDSNTLNLWIKEDFDSFKVYNTIVTPAVRVHNGRWIASVPINTVNPPIGIKDQFNRCLEESRPVTESLYTGLPYQCNWDIINFANEKLENCVFLNLDRGSNGEVNLREFADTTCENQL